MTTRREAVVGLTACALWQGRAIAAVPTPEPAPSFDLAPYRGRVVYLDFWASWCAPCRFSFPWMNDTHREFAQRGLAIVAVNVDRERKLADAFLAKNPAQFQVLFDPAGTLPRLYAIKAMPTSILIDRDGKTRHVHTGFFENQKSVYRSHIAELLAEKVS